MDNGRMTGLHNASCRLLLAAEAEKPRWKISLKNSHIVCENSPVGG